MLPIVDYGGIAIVVSKVTAVGKIIEDGGRFGIEVYLEGMSEPLVIAYDNAKEARDSREELISIIAQYYYSGEFDADIDLEDMGDEENPETDESEEKERH